MTDLVTATPTSRQRRGSGLPRGVVLIALALASWLVVAVLVVVAMRGLGRL